MINNKTKRVAVCLVINKDDKVLMGKRNDNGKWANPGGHLNKNECPFQGAIRELKEETGLDAVDVKLVRAGFKKDKGVLVYIFLTEVDENQEIDTSNDPDKEFDSLEYIDFFDKIDELHVPAEHNWGLEYWANN